MAKNLVLADLVIILPALILAFTIHEFAHAFAAVKCGDNTPKELGSYTLNPIRHISWIGLIMFLFAGFGWAKPVRYNMSNLKNPRTDSIIISIAGPLANLLAAFFFCLLFKLMLILKVPAVAGTSVYSVLNHFITINAVMFIFNLIPIPPLDGSHILLHLLPESLDTYKTWYLKYGNFLLLFLIFMHVAGMNVFGPLLIKTIRGIGNIFGI